MADLADFNDIISTYMSDNVVSSVSYHDGSLPANLNAAYVGAFGPIKDLQIYNSPTSSTMYAEEAYSCVLNTARAHSSIRRIWTGIKTTDRYGNQGTDSSVYSYSYLNSGYAIDVTAICNNIRNSAGLYAGMEISRRKLVDAVSSFATNLYTRINNSGTLDFRICHSSCHSNCHGSRSRR